MDVDYEPMQAQHTAQQYQYPASQAMTDVPGVSPKLRRYLELHVTLFTELAAIGGVTISTEQQNTFLYHLLSMHSGAPPDPDTVRDHAQALLQAFVDNTPLPPVPQPITIQPRQIQQRMSGMVSDSESEDDGQMTDEEQDEEPPTEEELEEALSIIKQAATETGELEHFNRAMSIMKELVTLAPGSQRVDIAELASLFSSQHV